MIITLSYRPDSVVGYITASSMYGLNDIEDE